MSARVQTSRYGRKGPCICVSARRHSNESKKMTTKHLVICNLGYVVKPKHDLASRLAVVLYFDTPA